MAFIPTDVLETEIFRLASAENRGCLTCERVEYRGMFGDVFEGVTDIEVTTGEWRTETVFYALYNSAENTVDVYTVSHCGGLGAFIGTFQLMV